MGSAGASFRPAFRSARLVAGAFAGLSGGLALGFPFYAVVIVNAEALVGPLHPGLFWILHMLVSITVGVIFSILVTPLGYASSIAWGLAYVMLGVYGIGHAVIWTTTALSPAFDLRTMLDFGGHVVYALTLSIAYVAYHRMMVREALEAEDERWRSWGERQAESARRRSA